MRNQYNMNQTTLSIATEFIPEPEHEVGSYAVITDKNSSCDN